LVNSIILSGVMFEEKPKTEGLAKRKKFKKICKKTKQKESKKR